MDALHAERVLRGDRGDRGHRVAAEHRHRLDVGLNPGAAAAVGPRNDENARGHAALRTISPALPDGAVRSKRGISRAPGRSEEHTSELQSLMRISYAVFCLK